MTAPTRASGRRWRRGLASPYVLAVVSGLLYTFAFPPFNVVVLGWFVLTPLVVALQKVASARRALLCGAITASLMCVIGYGWIADTAHRFWAISWVFAGALVLLYSTFGAINFTLFAGLYWLLRRRLAAWPAAATAALFAGVEFATPKIFPDALGHTQTALPAFPLAAALVGVHGLTFLIAWVGAAVAGLRFGSSDQRRRRVAELVASIAAALLFWAYGASRLHDEPPVQREIDLALVQTNIGDPVGLADRLGSFTAMEDSVLGVYMRATREAVRANPNLDFVLWPETAVPLPGTGVELDPVRELARELPVPLIFGAYDFQRSATGKWDVYNALLWMDTQGNVRDRYYKYKLIPLGETVPFADRFPFLRKIIPAPGVFARGDGARVMEIEGVRFTPMICYELLFPRYVRQGLHNGDEVLLNVTNDYWFGSYLEPQQHLALARMRAFETGRPIVRATNTGISAIIDARGRIVASAPVGSAETLHATVRIPAAGWTPFARWGEWLTLLQIACVLAAVAGAWRFGRL